MTEELSTSSRALLDAARQQGGLSSTRRAALTAAVATATSGTAAAMTTGAAVGGASVAKLVGAGLLAAVLGAAGTVAVTRSLAPAHPVSQVRAQPATQVRTPPPSPPTSVEPPPAPVATAEPAKPGPAPEKAAPRAAAAAPPPGPTTAPATTAADPAGTPEVPRLPVERSPAAATSSTTDSSSDEVSALGEALEALEAGHPAEALAVARRSRLATPAGVLHPELTMVEVDALCAMNRPDEARELAASMPGADRTPLVLAKLRRTCVGSLP